MCMSKNSEIIGISFIKILDFYSFRVKLLQIQKIFLHCALGKGGPRVANMAQSPSPLTNEIRQLSFIPSQPHILRT